MRSKAPRMRGDDALPLLRTSGPWHLIVAPPARAALEHVLPAYLQGCRWFGGKARRLTSATITDTIRIAAAGLDVRLALIRVAYAQGAPETYTVPLAFAARSDATRVRRQAPAALVAPLRCADGMGVLYDATDSPRFGAALCDAIAHRRRMKGARGTLVASRGTLFRRVRGSDADPLPEAVRLRGEQSNTSLAFGTRMVLKLLRRVAAGVSPDLEVGRFLSERARFPHVPPVAGSVAYERCGAKPITLGILQGFVPNRGDAWHYTLRALRGYFAAALVRTEPPPLLLGPARRVEPPAVARAVIGPYLDGVRLLGRRTAEMHLALAGDAGDADFAPAPFSTRDQGALARSLKTQVQRSFALLAQREPGLRDDVRAAAHAVLDLRPAVDRRIRRLLSDRLSGMRIRCHGDYHLGQVLCTGTDFVITDFEGEPARPLSERRRKGSPLRDVSGMMRSFHYAVYTAWTERAAGAVARPTDGERLEPWAQFWYQCVAAAFLTAYCATAAGAAFLPRTPEELDVMVEIFMLEKALYELAYELNNRPDWLHIPLRGIRALCEGSGRSAS